MSSVMQTFARTRTSLSDSQMTGLYHDLLAEGVANTAGEQVDQTRWREHVDAATNNFNRGVYQIARGCRNPLLRLADALNEVPLPERLYANERIIDRSRRADTAHSDWATRYAATTTGSRNGVSAAFWTLYAQAGESHSYSASDSFLNAWRVNPDNVNMPVDRRSLYAYEQMELRRDLNTNGVDRIPAVVRFPVPVERSGIVSELGYDPISGRCEVVFRSSPGTVYAYRLSPSQWRELVSAPSLGQAYGRICRNDPSTHYESPAAADQAAVLRRCSECGQFCASDHYCPLTGIDVNDPVAVSVALRLSAQAARVARAGGAGVGALVLSAPETVELPLQHTQRYFVDMASDLERGEHRPRIELRTPSVTRIVSAIARSEIVNVPVCAVVTPNPQSLTPYDFVDSNSDSGTVLTHDVVGVIAFNSTSGTADLSGLRCTCGRFTNAPGWPCSHITRTGEAMRDLAFGGPNAPTRVTRATVERVAAEFEQATAGATAIRPLPATNRTRGPGEPGEPDGRFTPVATSFTENPAEFARLYKTSRAQWATWRANNTETGNQGPSPIPFIEDGPAFGGVIGAPGDARTFGIELEYSFPPEWSRDMKHIANSAVGVELHRLGLTPNAAMDHYGASHGRLRTTHTGGWRFEEDSTTGGGGEVISPVMNDTAETWNNVKQVTEVLRRNGAVASHKAGTHVHVGVGDYGNQVAKHARLVAAVKENEDILYRLSTDPNTRTHRPLTYCAPNRDPGVNYRNVSEIASQNWGHSIGLNLQSVTGSPGDHVEFRVYDSTLDPGAIQGQIGTAMYIADEAARNDGGAITPRPEHTQLLGAHLANNSGRGELTGDAWDAQTASIRGFLDRFVPGGPGAEHRVGQMISMFAGTRWQKSRR